jgi:hypothetical protein
MAAIHLSTLILFRPMSKNPLRLLLPLGAAGAPVSPIVPAVPTAGAGPKTLLHSIQTDPALVGSGFQPLEIAGNFPYPRVRCFTNRDHLQVGLAAGF